MRRSGKSKGNWGYENVEIRQVICETFLENQEKQRNSNIFCTSLMHKYIKLVQRVLLQSQYFNTVMNLLLLNGIKFDIDSFANIDGFI